MGGINLWAAARRQAFELLGPTGLFVVAPDRPAAITVFEPDGTTVHKAIGHNQRSWPVKVGLTKSRRDAVTSLYNHSPWVRFGMQIRLWLPNHAEAIKLAECTNELLVRAAETAGYQPLLHGFHDAGPNFAVTHFEKYVLEIASRLGLVIWDEKALAKFIDRAIELAGRKGIQIVDGRGRRTMGMAPAFMRLCDRLVELEAKTLTQSGKAKYTVSPSRARQ